MKSNITRRGFMTSAAVTGSIMSAAGSRRTANTMKAGTAKVDITPDKPRYCVNSQLLDPPAVYHPVHARVLTLFDGVKRIVFVTYDLNCLDYATPILRERVENELGIPPAFLILLATHNHQVPMQTIPSNFDYGRWLAEQIFAGIKEAISKEDGPVDLHFGFDYGYFLRAGGSAPADYEVQVLRVMKKGSPCAILCNHPTHPVRGPLGYGPSHPGYAMDDIEAAFPGALALYGDACGGNQHIIQPEGVTDRLAMCQRRGHDLAEVVIRVAKGKMEEITGPIESQLRLLDLPLAAPVPYNKALELAKGVPLEGLCYPPPDRRRPTNWIRMLLYHYKEGIPFPTKSSDLPCSDGGFFTFKTDPPRKYETRFVEVVGAKIGKLQFVAIQGEPCAPIGFRIKDALRHTNPIMVFGYFAERNLYTPTRELVRVDAYQASVIRIQFGSPVGWAPEVEDEVVKACVGLFKEGQGDSDRD